MLKLKYTTFSSDCLNEVTTESLMYTRGNSFLVKKCKFAQKTVGSRIRLSGEQIKIRYATKTFPFSQTSAVASGLVHLKKPKPNCAQGKNNEEAYSGYGLNKHLQSWEVSGIMLPVQVHRNQQRIPESMCSSHRHHRLLPDIMITDQEKNPRTNPKF